MKKTSTWRNMIIASFTGLRIFFFALIFGLLFSCSGFQQSPDPFDPAVVSEEVHSMLENYHRDMNARGLLEEFKYLDSSADFFWIPPGFGSALTFDSVRQILVTNAPQLVKVHFEWETLDVYPLSSRYASFAGKVRGKTTDKSGNDTRSLLLESGTAVKRDDGWKLLNGQTSIISD